VVEVNDNIVNLDGSLNINLWALNDEMGYDARIKERVDVEKSKRLSNRWII
jgi:hypothetical protein